MATKLALRSQLLFHVYKLLTLIAEEGIVNGGDEEDSWEDMEEEEIIGQWTESVWNEWA